MMAGPGQTVALIVFGIFALGFGAAVFRTQSMVRSALALLGSMAAVGGLFFALEAEFLGVLQLMMMATEMTIMAIFMVMFMMDPGGLGQMEMTHQKRASLTAGVIGGLIALALSTLSPWESLVAAAPMPSAQLHDLGIELMSRSMLIFETAGLAILLAMIVATTIALTEHRP
jgi:NADH:ubiquinone oxidoreductase subunit 6 (subunit J)